MVDAFSTATIGAGIGLSPYVNLGVGVGGRDRLPHPVDQHIPRVAGVRRIPVGWYGRIGPTEARIVLIAANVALALSGSSAAAVPIATGAATALVVGMLVMVAVRIGRNLSQLARLEPPPTSPPISSPPLPYRRTAFTAANASTYPAPTSHSA